jgi:hypothetical protein
VNMTTEVHRCRDWNHFKEDVLSKLFGREPFERGIFLFRGQRSSNWPLKASFDRWFENVEFPESMRVSVAEKLVREFERHGRGLHFPSLSDERNGTLALAQHYGLPTRLLDWTESPYTAAFFAFAEALEKSQDDSCVAIHALDTRSYVWKGRGVTLMRVLPDGNVRLRNQDGLFTLLESASTTLEDHIASLPPEDPWPLHRFEIPSSEAVLALSELDIMGAHAARLFPDLQGCCQSAKMSVLLNRSSRCASY